MSTIDLWILGNRCKYYGAVTQAILIAISVVIYTPFLISYEKYQNKQAVEA
nr:hypothetical protein [uncultured Faecalibacillus sp.]